MGITKTTMLRLPDAEREEVEQILQEFAGQRGQFTSRYMSTAGDTLAWYMLLGLVALGGLIAGFVEDVPARWLESFEFGPRAALMRMVRSPEVLGFAAAVVLLPWCVATIVRTRRRCGWAATSFGVMRVFGSKLKLLRYADIAHAERRVVNVRRPFSVLELTATDGGRMTMYATPLMDSILARVPARS